MLVAELSGLLVSLERVPPSRWREAKEWFFPDEGSVRGLWPYEGLRGQFEELFTKTEMIVAWTATFEGRPAGFCALQMEVGPKRVVVFPEGPAEEDPDVFADLAFTAAGGYFSLPEGKKGAVVNPRWEDPPLRMFLYMAQPVPPGRHDALIEAGFQLGHHPRFEAQQQTAYALTFEDWRAMAEE